MNRVPAMPLFLLLVPVLAAAAGGLGCYRPSIRDGGFRCSDVTMACPDGFVCDLGTTTCVRANAGDGAAPVDTGRVDARDAADARDASAEMTCFTPVAGCTPQAGTCDPVCQTGCACSEKCSANTSGTLGCNPLLGTTRRALGQSCDISGAGTAAQTDNCDVGLVCLQDSCGSGRCYRFCRADNDCQNATCTRDAGGGVKICDAPFVTCDPVGRAAVMTCPTAAQGCYLSPTMSDRTLCDCPFGAQRENDSCTLSRDCLPGLVCVDTTGTGQFRCQPVCTFQGTGGCSNSRTCAALNGSTMYGYCRP